MTVDDLATLLSWLPEDAHPAAQGKCPACGGNDGDMPCAYPSDGQKGCLRDARLVAQGKGRTPEVELSRFGQEALGYLKELARKGSTQAEELVNLISAQAEQVTVLEGLVKEAVGPMMQACANSYVNKWLENWLTKAKQVGVYEGRVIGKLLEVEDEWEKTLAGEVKS